MKPKSYAEAGVDVEEIKRRHNDLAKIFSSTFKFRRGKVGSVYYGIGHYAGLIDLNDGRLLATHIDGVGTKVIIAQKLNRYNTIGIDCVAMNVNDIICVGAEPLAFLDYLALKKPDEHLIKEVAEGVTKGASMADVAVVGGETAVLPDLLAEDERTFDLAGAVVGLVEKDNLVTGEKIDVGEVVVGVNSSGIHSNGLTLARKLLLNKYSLDETVPPLNRSLGDELLEPTLIYVKPVLEILRKKIYVSGLAHITGGAFSKLTRLTKGSNLGFNLDDPPEPQPIFKLIQKEGELSNEEMYRTFNMGVGFCVVTRGDCVDEVGKIFKRHGFDAKPIGKVVRGRGVIVKGVKIA
ncbi:MAG: phosphoribosylformylglycinamidine cyclo-ligase [Nitrososphaerales archaeon]